MALPRTTAPAHLLFPLVNPGAQPDEHLRSLAALARPAGVEEVVERFAPDMPRGWLRARG